jgi:periplasmic protein TonB
MKAVVKEGVIPPKLISGTDPKYPKKARKSKKDGKVVLSVVIGIDGKPQEITVKEAPDNEFAGCATDAVRKWRFKPGTKDGKPVPVLITVDVSFHMS